MGVDWWTVDCGRCGLVDWVNCTVDGLWATVERVAIIVVSVVGYDEK